jgi:hypothetical protein
MGLREILRRCAIVSTATVALLGIAVLAPAAAGARPVADPAATAAIRSVAELPAGGRWVLDSGATLGERPAQAAQPRLVDPIPQPCRRERSHPPGFQKFNCLAYYKDNGNQGHPVLLRVGTRGERGFGYLHTYLDHGLDERTVATVIVNNAFGIKQPNDRFRYGLRYQFGSHTVLSIEVYEQREPHEDFDDGDGLGVVTAFCVGMERCPEGINESIAASIDRTRR